MNVKIFAILFALVLMVSGAFAYQGFNRYYYTDNYHPTTYYPVPAVQTYSTYSYYGATSYPYYYNTYYTYPTYYYPTYTTYPAYSTYTTYTAPVTTNYRTIGAYSVGDGWGFYYNTGSVCGYYGYC
jgi:hypothetical protein